MTKFVKKNRIILFIVINFIIFLILIGKLFKIQFIDYKLYKEKFNNIAYLKQTKINAPRGNIYDRNFNLLVENTIIKTINYKKKDNTSFQKELEIAKLLAEKLEIDYSKLTTRDLKEFFIADQKENSNNLITENEMNQYKKKILSNDDIKKLKLQRITEESLNIYENRKEEIYLYFLMNTGYSKTEKVLKYYATDKEYAYISENEDILNGVFASVYYERDYIYNDILKGIYGKIGNIPSEESDYYLKKDYELNSIVGTSFIEKQYEEYLKGTNEEYSLTRNGTKTILEKEKSGNDLILTIDIDIQKKLENIVNKNINLAKKSISTKYFDKLFVVISNPNNGEILALSGKNIININNGYKVINYDHGIISDSITVGSIVKGATMYTGYKYNAVKIGEKRLDRCIKISGVKEKCSWSSYLGTISDVKAIAQSSNAYQFLTAINLTGSKYTYNVALNNVDTSFTKFRDTFKEFGLGTISGIDLPNEKVGYKGTKLDAGTLLDFSIGQFDNYTTLEVLTYVNTVATGKKTVPHLLKHVYESTTNFSNLIYSYDEKNEQSLNAKYLGKIQEGFKEVIKNGTGRNYTNKNACGKTGTAESFLDTNNDNKIDTKTYTKTFVMYYPCEKPKYSVAILAPNIGHEATSSYIYPITLNISKEISNFLFNF
ncbi:MAG: penicillin-binding transpeptidase domain-containing protein [Bacilli bacterium]